MDIDCAAGKGLGFVLAEGTGGEVEGSIVQKNGARVIPGAVFRELGVGKVQGAVIAIDRAALFGGDVGVEDGVGGDAILDKADVVDQELVAVAAIEIDSAAFSGLVPIERDAMELEGAVFDFDGAAIALGGGMVIVE